MYYIIVGLFAISASLFVSETEARTLCTVILDPANDAVLLQQGNCRERVTPASTFKIPLSLMGFDAGFLKDAHAPALPFKEGYTYWGNPTWREVTDPTAWMKNSVVWYSQQITHALGQQKFKHYVDALRYGNRDVSGDPGQDNALERSWISSSITISPLEQAQFLSQLVNRRLPVSAHAHEMTMQILRYTSVDGWNISGKTGAAAPRKADGSLDRAHFYGWYVGWAEQDGKKRVFVRLIQEEQEQQGSAGMRARDAFLKELPGLLAKRAGPQ